MVGGVLPFSRFASRFLCFTPYRGVKQGSRWRPTSFCFIRLLHEAALRRNELTRFSPTPASRLLRCFIGCFICFQYKGRITRRRHHRSLPAPAGHLYDLPRRGVLSLNVPCSSTGLASR